MKDSQKHWISEKKQWDIIVSSNVQPYCWVEVVYIVSTITDSVSYKNLSIINKKNITEDDQSQLQKRRSWLLLACKKSNNCQASICKWRRPAQLFNSLTAFRNACMQVWISQFVLMYELATKALYIRL